MEAVCVGARRPPARHALVHDRPQCAIYTAQQRALPRRGCGAETHGPGLSEPSALRLPGMDRWIEAACAGAQERGGGFPAALSRTDALPSAPRPMARPLQRDAHRRDGDAAGSRSSERRRRSVQPAPAGFKLEPVEPDPKPWAQAARAGATGHVLQSVARAALEER
ncbi:hypothetical protein HYPSUDRAFT_202102 [Hypholoma sublateritium FD-334 SS-4]|uniref:Uncharacterized protein n=1 Tax=Hypholoma sublateritium (strain FD-334 SS-4) TaxID=945553 RepID=A0A0D2NUI8_HYPSF|nr:hypothetical protein HYPSUDRAFT_202102 [Hypholoma sublateritium FD-334 SS-4]